MKNARLIGLLVGIFLLLQAPVVSAADPQAEQGKKLFEEKNYTAAKNLLESSLLANPGDYEAAFYLGRIAIINDDVEKSIGYLEKAVELHPNDTNYRLWLGNSYGAKAQSAGIFKQASLAGKVKKEFEKAVELDPDNLQARSGLMQYYLQAPGIMGGSDKKALQQAEEIKKRNMAMGCQAYAQIYTKDKKYDLAEKEYLSAIAQCPDSLDLRYGLGFLYQQTEKYDQAFSVYEAVLKEHPENATALYQIGRTASISGQNLERATACLQTYMTMTLKEDEPPLEWAHYRLGTIYEKAGKIDLAKQEYQEALKLKPDQKEAKEALKKLK
ncbi:MAG: tetratricopeptide repeat protein [bacterium]|nr:tetratricopeptide repeat protein [bacterium]